MKKLFVWSLALASLGAAGCKKEEPPRPSKGGSPVAAAAAPIYTASLTREERRELYHLPEGGELIPLNVLRSVESIRTFKPFMEDLERFRLIPDPDDPDGLPIGMSAALVDGKRPNPPVVFFNCAACHTTEITYRGQRLQVDGAPSHFDLVGFIVELLQSVDSTVVDPQRLARFAGRMRGQVAGSAIGKAEIAGALQSVKLLKEKLTYVQRIRGLRPTTPVGYGRLDAFVAARDLLFGDAHSIDVNSPVSLPPLFGLTRLAWFHYDNNTNSLLQRNIGQDLGVGAVADLHTGQSTVEVRSVMRLEQLCGKLPPPKWPEALFGKLDAGRVERGAAVYKRECAGCHEGAAGEKFPDRVVPLGEIGTDPNRLQNFGRPVGDQPFATALGGVLDLVERKAFEREHVTPAEAAAIEPPKVVWRTTPGYSARPLDGVWATAPYLHNGSVPTLYDLLLPPAERPKTFLSGSRELDPVKVGYVTDGGAGATFLIDTSLDGNHNGGHVYGTTLAPEVRLDLLEYLKSR